MSASYGLSHWLDILTVVLYFVFVIGVGIWSIFHRKRSNVEGYFLAGRSMPWFAVGASIFGSNIGSEHFVGLAGAGAASGIVFVLFEWVPGLIIQALSWFFLPVFISAGVYTLPEYMERRFGRGRLRIYLSVLALFVHIVTRLSVTIFSGAIYIQLALNWNMYASIVGILVLTAVFTIFGGLTAVMFTDTAQSVIMVIGAFVVMGLSLDKIGGFDNLVDAYQKAIPAQRDNSTTCGLPRADAFHVLRGTDSDFPWPTMILQTCVASAWYWICDQIMVQRTLAAKNISHAKSGTLLGGYLKILPMFIMVVPGMISRILFPDEVACVDPEVCKRVCDNPAGCSNIAYPKLVLELLPQGARGLIMAVMLSAIVTSLTSIFNSSSTVFTMDLWRRFRPKANQRELLMVGRGYIVLLCVLTILWIPVVKAATGGQLFHYLVVVEGFITAPLPILFVLAVFWNRTSEQGAFYSIVVTHVLGVTRLVLEVVYPVPHCGEPDTRPAFLSQVHSFYYSEMLMALQAILIIVISLCTKPRPKHELAGTTWSTRIRARGADSSSVGELEDKEGGDLELGSTHGSSQDVSSDPHDVPQEPVIPVTADLPPERRGFLDTMRGLLTAQPRDQNDDVTISVTKRRQFLQESAKWVVTVNNCLAIFLVAIVGFLVGFFH